MRSINIPEAKKLPSGNWFIQLRLSGKSISITEPTKKECENRARLIKSEHMAGERIERCKKQKTLKEIMQSRIDSMSVNTSPATIRGYYIILKHHFMSCIDKAPEDVCWQKLIDEESEQFSPKTVRNAWGFLKTSLKHYGYTVPDVTMPQNKKSERPFLEPDEILKVIAELKGRKYEIPALLALHSLRRSEIMALDYSDIDLKEMTIRVHGSCVQDKDNKLVTRSVTKTEASQRTVPIMIPRLAEAIRETGCATGRVWDGTPCALYRTMEDVCKKLGIQNVGAHGLRHSFASLAYSLGMTPMETAEIGGWDDYNTMLEIYTHLAKRDRAKAVNKMTKFYENANENANESKTQVISTSP